MTYQEMFEEHQSLAWTKLDILGINFVTRRHLEDLFQDQMRAQLDEYRLAEPCARHRIIDRRIDNPEYRAGQPGGNP